MNKKQRIISAALMLTALAVQANPILWDLNNDTNPNGQGTVDNFIALGVTEDLTDAIVSEVIASPNSAMTDGTITLSYLNGIAHGVADEAPTTGVLYDYLYLEVEGQDGPVTNQISGLSSVLEPNQTYSFYLIGAGKTADQGTQFTFDNIIKTTTSGATPAETTVKYSFTTGTTVSDTLDFTWERKDDNTYAALNGFAIVAIPEPATMSLIALFGMSLLIFQKSRIWFKSRTIKP
jgi:hypothetical protein